MATRQNLQLEELSYEYELFRENQLLTHEQLNKFIRYFEDQDRLTRTCLIGVGLVCGLSAKVKNNVLTVGQGCAVTTDGDLLRMETTDYRFFKEYSNLTRGKGEPIYDPFFSPAGGGKQVRLWELMATDVVETGNKPAALADFDKIAGKSLTDMVALLYLEYYLSEPDDCTSIDCDHLGQLQHARIKVLLLAPEDMDKVINSEPAEIIADHIYKSYYDAYNRYFDLPELTAKRLPMTSLNTAGLGALTGGYRNVVLNGAAALGNALDDLYNTFRFILDPAKYFKIATIKNKLNGTLTASVKPYQVQYLYDFYKDIIDCYNELKDTIYNAIYICCPDKYAFPKHIMLGIVNGDPGPRPPKYRHYFYPSPAVTKNKSYLSVARSMFNRLADMISGFSLPDQPAAVRITPSVDAARQMEWRAIPFYYKNAAVLREHWSYYRKMRGTDRNLLSYHGVEYGENEATRSPLDFDLDKHNFFRIEGHMGKKMKEAMEAVLKIRNDKSLPFDVVAVRMDEKLRMEINPEDFTCQFDDLNAVLNAWIVEQDCLYAKIVKFFSSFDNKGKNRLPVKNSALNFATKSRYQDLANNMSRSGTGNTMMKAAAPAAAPAATATTRAYMADAPYTYQVDDTVNTNLNLEADTVGAAYQLIRQSNTMIFLGDAYIGMLMQYADLNDAIKLLSADVREIVYNIPVRLIARINDVTRYKPFEIKDLNTDVLENYRKAIETLCDEAEASRVKAEVIFAKTSYPRQGYEQQYMNALVALAENCCAAEKLDALISEIENRKRKILESLSFRNYAAQHNGLEHKAGVPAGGTFVLLYASVSSAGKGIGAGRGIAAEASGKIVKKTAERDISDFFAEDEDTFLLELVNRKTDLDAPETVKAYLVANGYDIMSISGKVRTGSLLTKAGRFAAELAAEQAVVVNNEMVVADFCLPYLCCSDCPPMVFMVPKQQYSLSLPKEQACSDEAPLAFRKEPQDGVVAAAAGFEDTVVVKDGTTFFDPAKVKETDFGKTIPFTIDGQVTDCSIKVWKHPAAKFTATVLEETRAVIRVRYDNESDDATGKQYTYEWNFGDGRAVEKVGTKDPIEVTYKRASFGNAASFKVTLKAINNTCSSVAEQLIPLTDIQEPVGLEPEKDRTCENDRAFGFKVTPEKGVVACKEVPQAVLSVGGVFTFNPSLVPASLSGLSLHFTVNGKDVPATVTVFAAPDASFAVDESTIVRTADSLAFSIILRNPGDFVYTIEIPEGGTADGLKPDTKGVIVIPALNIKGVAGGKTALTLRASAPDSPCDIATETQSLPVPEELQETQTCAAIVRNQLTSAGRTMAALRKSVANNPDTTLVNVVSSVGAVYDMALKAIKTLDQPATATQVLSRLKEIFNALLALRMDKEEDRNTAGILLNLVLVLLLDIVRCPDKLDPKVKDMVMDMLQNFLKNASNMAPFFPTLNKGGGLTGFIAEFRKAMVAKDKDILAILQQILKMLDASYPK